MFICLMSSHKNPQSKHSWPILQMQKLEAQMFVQSASGESVCVRDITLQFVRTVLCTPGVLPVRVLLRT